LRRTEEKREEEKGGRKVEKGRRNGERESNRRDVAKTVG